MHFLVEIEKNEDFCSENLKHLTFPSLLDNQIVKIKNYKLHCRKKVLLLTKQTLEEANRSHQASAILFIKKQ